MPMIKPIPSFPDYFADDLGNIYSQRMIGRPAKNIKNSNN